MEGVMQVRVLLVKMKLCPNFRYYKEVSSLNLLYIYLDYGKWPSVIQTRDSEIPKKGNLNIQNRIRIQL